MKSFNSDSSVTDRLITIEEAIKIRDFKLLEKMSTWLESDGALISQPEEDETTREPYSESRSGFYQVAERIEKILDAASEMADLSENGGLEAVNFKNERVPFDPNKVSYNSIHSKNDKHGPGYNISNLRLSHIHDTLQTFHSMMQAELRINQEIRMPQAVDSLNDLLKLNAFARPSSKTAPSGPDDKHDLG